MAENDTEKRSLREGLNSRLDSLEGVLNKSSREGSKWSWGLILLLAFALYAIVNLIIVVLKLF